MSTTINRDISGIDFGDFTKVDVDQETNTTNNNNGKEDDSGGNVGLIVGLTLSLVGNVAFILSFIVYFVKYKSAMSMINKLQNPPNEDESNNTE